MSSISVFFGCGVSAGTGGGSSVVDSSTNDIAEPVRDSRLRNEGPEEERGEVWIDRTGAVAGVGGSADAGENTIGMEGTGG